MSRPGVRLAALCLGASVVLSASAQLLFRAGMRTDITTLITQALQSADIAPLLSSGGFGMVLLGLCCYVLSMLCWLPAISRFELSFAYPLLTLSYILVYLGAAYWPGLGETRSALKLLGMVLIGIGIYQVSVSRSAGATAS